MKEREKACLLADFFEVRALRFNLTFCLLICLLARLIDRSIDLQIQEEISREREELMKTVSEFEKLSTEENSRLKNGKSDQCS